MKVSVIVPFHRGLHFITDCLDSLSEQTWKDFETLIIKDHVEEKEADKLLSSYKDKLNLRIYDLHEKNGVSAARNLGIQKAQGEYLYFLDSDDYLAETTLEELVDAAEKENYDLTYGVIKQTWFRRMVYYGAEQHNEEDQEFCGQPWKDLVENRIDVSLLSCIHMLIKKSGFDEECLCFDEDLEYYCDIPLLAYFLEKTKSIGFCKKADYIKRGHNDEIQYPSLSKADIEDRPQRLSKAYKAIGKITPELKGIIDQKFVTFCGKGFLQKVRRDKASEWKNSRFLPVHEYAQTVDNSRICNQEDNEKKVLKALQQESYEACKKKINHILARRKIHRMLTEKRFLYRTISKYIFERFSQQDQWVVFESFFGKQYSDSPKYIYEYLLKNYGDQYKFIWIINDKSMKIPGNPKKVPRFSLGYFYYITRAKYWVTNVRQPVWFEKRDSQYLLETWHGTPLKKLGFDMEENYSASPTYKRQIYSQSRFWDCLVSANPFSTEAFHTCFLYEKEKIIETGYPRNDILYAPNKEQIAAELKKKLGIPADKKTILYAPTWRDDEYYDHGAYKFNLALDLKRLQKEIGDEYVVLLRTHYFIADAIDVTGMEDFVFNVCKYPDIAELYLISDICMTDYSSVFFDFANLRRPILFFTYDLEKYRDILHGFYIDIQTEVPGPLLMTNDEVINAIKNIDQIEEQYKEKYDEFYDRFCCFDDGHATERIVNMVFNK